MLNKAFRLCIVCLLITVTLATFLCCFSVGVGAEPSEEESVSSQESSEPVSSEEPSSEEPSSEEPSSEEPSSEEPSSETTTEKPGTTAHRETTTAYIPPATSPSDHRVLPEIEGTKFISVNAGKTVKLTNHLTGYIVYRVGDEKIAKVSDDGTVTGVKKGVTWVQAYNTSYVQKYQINVLAANEVVTDKSGKKVKTDETVNYNNTLENGSYLHNETAQDEQSGGTNILGDKLYLFIIAGVLILGLIIAVVIIAVRSKKKIDDDYTDDFDELSDASDYNGFGEDDFNETVEEDNGEYGEEPPYENDIFSQMRNNYTAAQPFEDEAEEDSDDEEYYDEGEYTGEFEDVYSFDPDKVYINNDDETAGDDEYINEDDDDDDDDDFIDDVVSEDIKPDNRRHGEFRFSDSDRNGIKFEDDTDY